VMVEHDDPERTRCGFAEQASRVLELCEAESAGLVEPGSDRVQADDVERVGVVDRLRRPPVALELDERLREAGDGGVGDVVVSRHREDRAAELVQERSGALVLLRSTPVREIAAGDDQLWIDAVDEVGERRFEARFLAGSDVQIREVKNPCRLPGHSRGRLYTQIVVDEPTEIFDDLYLGLRAGGALRKKRRGEPLTTEEEEALGRWQRLARARKIVALGAFTLGTFGLGFTIGGLIFGKWRRA
jgi:hypothetical protein